jgi:hypothetical protein
MEQVYEGRLEIQGKIYNGVITALTDEYGNELYDQSSGQLAQSSYPHLTHKKDARNAHVTSSRVVFNGPQDPYLIHQRFHQDVNGGSEPVHDRFFAVNTQTNQVHNVSMAFGQDVHLKKNESLPDRGTKLEATSGTIAKITWTVGEVDRHHPPMSPRSQRRIIPDTGYPTKETKK